MVFNSTNPEIVKLCMGLQEKSISIQTVADNTGASFGYCQKMIYAAIPGVIFNPDNVNENSVIKILKFKKIDAETFSMDNWKLPEARVLKSSIDFQLNQEYKLPKSFGKQSPDCIYAVKYATDGYVLFVPVRDFAVDDAGISNKTPRIMGAGVACQLDPELIVA